MANENANGKMPTTCSSCGIRACWENETEKFPPFCVTTHIKDGLVEESVEMYHNNETDRKISITSAEIEGEFYGRLTRVEETIEFIRRMGYKRIGIASCVGCLDLASTFVKILKGAGIESYTASCKAGAVDKSEIGVNEKKLNKGTGHESMCNPILQAKILASQNTDFNIVIGLCVGHDTLFLKYSQAPTTVMIVKDRVMAHNPAGALYSAKSIYSRFKKELGLEGKH